MLVSSIYYTVGMYMCVNFTAKLHWTSKIALSFPPPQLPSSLLPFTPPSPLSFSLLPFLILYLLLSSLLSSLLSPFLPRLLIVIRWAPIPSPPHMHLLLLYTHFDHLHASFVIISQVLIDLLFCVMGQLCFKAAPHRRRMQNTISLSHTWRSPFSHNSWVLLLKIHYSFSKCSTDTRQKCINAMDMKLLGGEK